MIGKCLIKRKLAGGEGEAERLNAEKKKDFGYENRGSRARSMKGQVFLESK